MGKDTQASFAYNRLYHFPSLPPSSTNSRPIYKQPDKKHNWTISLGQLRQWWFLMWTCIPRVGTLYPCIEYKKGNRRSRQFSNTREVCFIHVYVGMWKMSWTLDLKGLECASSIGLIWKEKKNHTERDGFPLTVINKWSLLILPYFHLANERDAKECHWEDDEEMVLCKSIVSGNLACGRFVSVC